jgi:hypothetical protein
MSRVLWGSLGGWAFCYERGSPVWFGGEHQDNVVGGVGGEAQGGDHTLIPRPLRIYKYMIYMFIH